MFRNLPRSPALHVTVRAARQAGAPMLNDVAGSQRVLVSAASPTLSIAARSSNGTKTLHMRLAWSHKGARDGGQGWPQMQCQALGASEYV